MIKFRLANYVITVFVIFFVSPAAANWFFEDNSIKGQTVYVANEKNLNVHILQDKEFYQYRFLWMLLEVLENLS